MSGSGYFDRIGARVAAMSQAPAPMPVVERLTMEAPAEIEPVEHGGPKVGQAQEGPSKNNRAQEPSDSAQLLSTIETHLAEAESSDADPTTPPQESIDLAPSPQQRPREPAEVSIVTEMAPLDPPAPIEPPDKGSIPAVAPQPDQKPSADPATRDLTPNIPAPEATQTDADETADKAPTKELTPEEHIALFEKYIDTLNDRETAAPLTPPPDIQPQPKPQAAAPLPPEPVPRSPTLEIGEITVEVQASRPAAPPSASPKAPRRSPPRAIPMRGRLSGLRPM